MRRRLRGPSVLAALGLGLILVVGCGAAERWTPREQSRPIELARKRIYRIAPVASTVLAPAQARRLASRLAAGIPLPKGGNFDGIRWESAAEGVPSDHVVRVLEFNALCQWLRASQERRQPRVAEAVLLHSLNWVHLRAAPRTPEVIAECYASHRREVAHARDLGLAPSR